MARKPGSSIVTYEHRYKRPPKKKPQAAKIEGPAVITIRKRGSGEVPDLTPEGHRRRGDAAEALFREMKRRIAATKERQGGA